MVFTKICVILISVLLICGLTEQTVLNDTQPLPLKLRPDSDIGPQQLVYLGTVDGAVYYVEREIRRNWANAKLLCEGFDIKLKLATVLSRTQHDFLLNNLQESHWIGAQEFMGDKAFRWEGMQQNPVIYKGFYYCSNRHWCLTLKNEGGLQGFGSDACTKLYPTLCQLIL